jgi:hypothetical protein
MTGWLFITIAVAVAVAVAAARPGQPASLWGCGEYGP